MSELKLVKTAEGYKPLSNGEEASAPLPPLGRALRDFLVDLRPAFNLLVLKTPPSGAQPLAAALDAEKFKEIAGTIAGDDTVLVITPSQKARAAVQQRAMQVSSWPSFSFGTQKFRNRPSICAKVPRM
jgi:transcriptional regulator of arginine metabolism